MPKPLKLYTSQPANVPAPLKEALGVLRNDRVLFVVCSTSKQSASDALGVTGVHAWPMDMSVVYGVHGRLEGTLRTFERLPGNVYAVDSMVRDRSPVLKWTVDPDSIPGTEEDLGTDVPTGRWEQVGEVDDGTRPRFGLTALRKLDLDDEVEVQAFFHKIGVVVLDD